MDAVTYIEHDRALKGGEPVMIMAFCLPSSSHSPVSTLALVEWGFAKFKEERG